MATRQSGLRCDSTTRLLPLEINAHLSWHSYGCSRLVEKIRHRQNWSKSLPQSAWCVQHDLEQSHSKHHDQHTTRWRGSQPPVERSMGAVQKTEPSHRLLWEEGEWGLHTSQRNTKNWTTEKEPLPRRDKIYVPRVMLNLMQATTGFRPG